MPVGFGYIRDEQPAIVDWSAITREARDTIKSIESDRQKKREGVDQAIRDQSEALLNRPKSQNTEYNSAMSNMTTQIEATMLQNYNDLRLGNINLNQFNATKNTMMSETKGVLAIAKIYADQYDANVEGAQNGTLSGFSNWTNAMTQEMMDFQGVETYVGPNGKISFVKKKEDGTTETLDTSELFTLANMKQQKFDMEGAIDTAKGKVEFLYKDQYGETKKGYFVDPLTGTVNEESISSSAASVVAQDSNAYGILYDYIGGYDFKRLSDDFFAEHQTGEEQKKALEQLQKENKNVIYIDSNGMPIVSKEQRDVAQAYIEKRLRSQATTGFQQAQVEAKGEKDISMTDKIRNIALYGDKVPIEFIEKTLTPEEFKEYKTFINKSGGRSAIGKVIDDLTFMISPENISDKDFQNKDSLQDYLKALETIGVKAEVDGSGFRGILSKPSSITLTERGGDEGVSIEVGDKNKRQVIDEIVRIIPTIRSLEDIALGMKVTQAQIPSLTEWSRRPENDGKSPVDYIKEFNLQTVD